MGVEENNGAAPRSYRYVEAWGMAEGHYGRVVSPRSVEEIAAALAQARAEGVTVGLRGTGNSYGDASLNREGSVLDLSHMDRILSFDEETGVVEVEPGVTVQKLWRHILPSGFWPRVVSGTSFPTLAGAAAMNIHGKNNFAVGTIGDAILEFDLVLPDGRVETCSRERNPELFHGAIGGFGMLGVFGRLKLQTKRVHSGELEVTTVATHDLGEMMAYMDARRSEADYLVGWVDCFAGGDGLGRGQVHDARYLGPGEDAEASETLTLAHQAISPMAFGVLPKSEIWRILRLLNHDLGMRFLNAVRYVQGRVEGNLPPRRWTHAEFSFLLDYVPNWKWSYGRYDGRGLIQYQPFVPKETAHGVFTEILERSQAAGLVPYLGVFKRHRPDDFLLTHAVDGWSFALDFKVTPANRERLWRHCAELTEIVLAGGGRFYFAKDLVLGPDVAARMYPADNLGRFLALKRELDPDGLLTTDLWRRVFGEVAQDPTRA